MKTMRVLLLLALLACNKVAVMAQSPTEGVLNSVFVDEATMKQDLLQMLADFSLYMKNDFNSVDNTYGYFNGESSGQSNEAGVRTNADLSMICAFLVKYARPAGVKLPNGVTWATIQTMAKKSLAWAYATHKANKLRQTTNSSYWGSTASGDSQWESSLWAMSVAYSAFFQWDSLTAAQKGYIYAMLKAECNYELTRSIPTGFAGDTKAEENGWEVNILASALGLFPNDNLAPQWFERMRQFAVNSYSHVTDLKKNNPIDPEYDGKSVSDLFMGKNLYDDYTLQNHNMFHTSYQNVVMQEIGESALALKMFQMGVNGSEKWQSKTLMHNNQEVMDNILNWLATADGELAMPNGNDWSLFLFDQITSYSTQACFQRDPNALLLENLAYKNIKARQTTTSDGSWLLRPDVSARRMGVEAHRVMMTYLMHEYIPTADLAPTSWDEFRNRYAKTKFFPDQNIIRSMSKDRFTCFSWNTSLPDYSGVIVPNSVDKAKIMVPFRTHHTGNLLGVYSKADYSSSISGRYAMFPEGYAMNGKVTFNSIPQSFCFYSTSGNAVILVDALKANSPTSVSSEQGGMMGVSVDEFTKTKRTIYYNGGNVTTDGSSYSTWTSPWSNIDNYLGFVVTKHGETVTGAFGDKSNNNSIMTAKIYPSYKGSSSAVGTDMNHIRGFVYYTGVTAAETHALSDAVVDLTMLPSWPEGWHGILVPDPDGTYYMLLSNLFASDTTPWTDLTVTCPKGAPVFTQETTIVGKNATATFHCAQNYNIANEFKVFISGATSLKAVQEDENSRAAYLLNETETSQTITVGIIDANGNYHSGSVSIPANTAKRVCLKGTAVTAETTEFPGNYRNVAYGSSVDAGSYDGAHLPFSVIDNDDNSYYLSLNSASSGTEYLKFNMRNQYKINKIVITPQNGQTPPSSYIAQYGDDESGFKSLPNVTTSIENGNTVLSFDDVYARFVKIQFLGSSQVAVSKVAIYGAIPLKINEGEEIGDDCTSCMGNPSFEADKAVSLSAVTNPADGLRGYTCDSPTEWTISGTDVTKLIVTPDCYTDNNFGKVTTVPDGSQAYYFRMGWSTGTTTFQTTSAELPAGKYKVCIDYRTAYVNGASSSFVFTAGGTSTSNITFDGGSNGCFTSKDWSTASVELSLNGNSVITPTVEVTWKSGGSCIMVDNLRVYKITEETDQVELNRQQIINNGGDATFLLQDPKCESAANTSWSGSTGRITLKEHWSGAGYDDTYQERTSSGKITQTVSNMPAGTYKVVAALRAYSGGKITPKLNGNSGITFTGTGNNNTSVSQINKNGVQMPYNPDRGFTTKSTGHGWQWGSATATIDEPGNLTIEFDMVGNSWMSIDDVHLYLMSDGNDTYCESINADVVTGEVSVDKTVTADIIVANPNTVVHSSNIVYSDNDKLNNNLAGSSMDNLVLYDNYSFSCSASLFELAKASYLRTLSDDWGALILPYPLTSNDKVQFYKMTGVNDEYMFFSEIDDVPANTPVIFQRIKGDSQLMFNADKVSAVGTDQPQGQTSVEADGWSAIGKFSLYEESTPTNSYYIQNNRFYLADSTAGLKVSPFNSFFQTSSATDVKSLAIMVGEWYPTAINELIENGTLPLSDIYTLDGRILKHNAESIKGLPNGIYIVDNKKVIVR